MWHKKVTIQSTYSGFVPETREIMFAAMLVFFTWKVPKMGLNCYQAMQNRISTLRT